MQSETMQNIPTDFDLIKSMYELIEGQAAIVASQRERIERLEKQLTDMTLKVDRMDRVLKEWLV